MMVVAFFSKPISIQFQITAVAKVRFYAVIFDVNHEMAQQLFCDRAQTTIISSIANDEINILTIWQAN
ncbi:hypothetical protein [Klebsiella aerogenes]|uniref:hypothetical protein n=1 Tax=Klebsiella TaxID=570 RepID=UPI00277C5B65|nr:hypothetical protein [Klebsiella aerogenes]HBR7307951.1 hypothetical protein [Klebsiella aerogenes]HCR0142980.1 hypothetical protein [Klebsiella aerogenes]HDS6596240.1 hypothetical protein [Klebsiella aerogenes]